MVHSFPTRRSSDLLLHPSLKIEEPAKPSERSGRRVFGLSHGLRDGLLHRVKVTRVSETTLDEAADSHPFLFAWSFRSGKTWFHDFVTDLPGAGFRTGSFKRRHRYGVNATGFAEGSDEMFRDSLPTRNFDFRKCAMRSIKTYKDLRILSP